MRCIKYRHLTLLSYLVACCIIIYTIGRFYLINSQIEQNFYVETDSKSIYIYTAMRRHGIILREKNNMLGLGIEPKAIGLKSRKNF